MLKIVFHNGNELSIFADQDGCLSTGGGIGTGILANACLSQRATKAHNLPGDNTLFNGKSFENFVCVALCNQLVCEIIIPGP
jgi:hypothetical protein